MMKQNLPQQILAVSATNDPLPIRRRYVKRIICYMMFYVWMKVCNGVSVRNVTIFCMKDKVNSWIMNWLGPFRQYTDYCIGITELSLSSIIHYNMAFNAWIKINIEKSKPTRSELTLFYSNFYINIESLSKKALLSVETKLFRSWFRLFLAKFYIEFSVKI